MADPDAPGDSHAAEPQATAFAAAVTALIGRPLAPHEPFAVAVSGGGDSLALLALAHAAFGERVRVLTVDHGLSPGSTAAAAVVVANAAKLGLPCATLAWTGPKPAANLQAAARTARYRLLQAWCAANATRWLATAHHADDQAETVLLRLARGAALPGVSGIRPRRDLGGGVTLLRPLLDWRRATLTTIIADTGWTAFTDPANADPRFDRTRARALFAATPWLDAARLAASAHHLADAEAALAWTADVAWSGRAIAGNGVVTLDAAGLPHDLVRRLVLRALTRIAPAAAPRGPAVERLLARLSAGEAATLAGVRTQVVDAGGAHLWRFTRAPPRRKL